MDSSRICNEEQAIDYIEKHHLLDLFQFLMSQLTFYRPDDPKSFMIEKMKQLKSLKKTNPKDHTRFLDDENVAAIARALDTMKVGSISKEQCVKTLDTLGLNEFIRLDLDNINSIPTDAFIKELQKGMHKYEVSLATSI